jgi:hypothetical protein
MCTKKIVKIEDIIPEAFHDAVRHYNETARKYVKIEDIQNPYFFEKEIIISIDSIDKYNNIIYTADNRYPRGSNTEDNPLPFICIAFPYDEYIEFEKPYKRDKLLTNIIK